MGSQLNETAAGIVINQAPMLMPWKGPMVRMQIDAASS
jgi:hypothetical protein